MKTLTLIIALALSVNFSYAQDNENEKSITVTIENIANNKGKIILGLHTEDTFMKGQGIANAESEIIDGKITVTFENVEMGTLAIMDLHDENENKRMDFQENGMPKENYVMSKDPNNYGPTEYATAKFELKDENLELKIIL